MHDMKPQPKSSFITPTSKTPVKRSSHAEIMAKLEKRAAYLQQDDLTAVGAAMQAYYQRKLAAAAQEQDLPVEEIDSQKENQPSLVPEVQAKSQAKSLDIQQSSIPDAVQMKIAESGNEENLQQKSDAQTAQKPDIAGKSIQQIASIGFSDSPTTLPHIDQIQQSLGVNLSYVQAYIGGSAKVACQNIGATAFASGNQIAFKEAPSIELASHEATHVVQQQSGKVHLPSGVSHVGDTYETHADKVAATVARGQSAINLMGDYTAQSRQSNPQHSPHFQTNQISQPDTENKLSAKEIPVSSTQQIEPVVQQSSILDTVQMKSPASWHENNLQHDDEGFKQAESQAKLVQGQQEGDGGFVPALRNHPAASQVVALANHKKLSPHAISKLTSVIKQLRTFLEPVAEFIAGAIYQYLFDNGQSARWLLEVLVPGWKGLDRDIDQTLSKRPFPFQLGKSLGDGAALVQGIAEIDTGASSGAAGVALCFTGGGCIVGAPAIAVGLATGIHGATVVGSAATHIAEQLGIFFRHESENHEGNTASSPHIPESWGKFDPSHNAEFIEELKKFRGNGNLEPDPGLRGGEGQLFLSEQKPNLALKRWYQSRIKDMGESLRKLKVAKNAIEGNSKLKSDIMVVEVHQEGSDWILRDFARGSVPLKRVLGNAKAAEARTRVIGELENTQDPILKNILKKLKNNSENLHWSIEHDKILIIDMQ